MAQNETPTIREQIKTILYQTLYIDTDSGSFNRRSTVEGIDQSVEKIAKLFENDNINN